MALVTRWFKPADARAVRAIHGTCHPTWPARPAAWFHAHPTLVAVQDGEVVGMTSFSLALPPTTLNVSQGEIGVGHGVEVHHDYRGCGLGWALATARHAMLAELGVGFFIGMTQPDNAPMLAIFRKQGLTRHQHLRGVYPDGTDGVMYVGTVA